MAAQEIKKKKKKILELGHKKKRESRDSRGTASLSFLILAPDKKHPEQGQGPRCDLPEPRSAGVWAGF